jgi:hypothetical protein
MDKLEALRKVLEDPGRSDTEKEIARRALLSIRKPDSLGVEGLLQFASKSQLSDVPFVAAYEFWQLGRRWPDEVWESWWAANSRAVHGQRKPAPSPEELWKLLGYGPGVGEP